MPTASGMSNGGDQSLLTDVAQPVSVLALSFPGSSGLPVKRMGYWYLLQYEAGILPQHFIVQEGLLRAPGEYQKIIVPAFSPTALYRLYAAWNVPNVSWTATLA